MGDAEKEVTKLTGTTTGPEPVTMPEPEPGEGPVESPGADRELAMDAPFGLGERDDVPQPSSEVVEANEATADRRGDSPDDIA